jgi:sulfatase maturation enzyme AslB (radical SAM superfamily)
MDYASTSSIITNSYLLTKGHADFLIKLEWMECQMCRINSASSSPGMDKNVKVIIGVNVDKTNVNEIKKLYELIRGDLSCKGFTIVMGHTERPHNWKDNDVLIFL